MNPMRSIKWVALAGLLTGCATPKYGTEKQITYGNGKHPVWAVAPAVNLSGDPNVDPLLQADLLYHQLAAVNNVRVIPVNQVIGVYAALHLTKVESEEQAAIVCEQLGCDGLIVPTITVYDPYDPPKLGVALQLLGRKPTGPVHSLDVRELTRRATPEVDQPLPSTANFVQVVGMYDAINGSVRDAVHYYANGRFDPVGPLQADEYFVNMDRYCGFVYYTLINQIVDQTGGHFTPPIVTAKAE